jgi:hypothetical protein
MADESLQLERPDGSRSPATLDEVNEVLARYEARAWPLDLSGASNDQRRLLAQLGLSAAESWELLEHFLLPRERLLDLIAEAGREPLVPGGGEMSTLDVTHGVQYPELYLVEPGADYSRFDRLHVNRATDGPGVDETLQMLSGRGVRFVHSLPDVGTVTLFLSCPSPHQGWTLSYSGAHPHVASFTGSSEGTKVLMQIIGPPRWNMDYVDGQAT